MTRGVSGRIGSSSTSAPTSTPSTATNTLVAPSRLTRRRTSRAQPGSPAPPLAKSGVPARTSRPPTRPETPEPGTSTTSSGSGERHAPLTGAADDGRRQHVRRDLLQGGGDAQDVVGGPAGRGDHVGQVGTAGRQRAGLVEQQDAGPGERLQRPAALDDDPAAGRPADPGHDRDRHREQQRARRRDHEDRQRPDGVAGQDPGQRGHAEGKRDEQQRVPVGQADERRLGRLRLLHQAHDARVRAVLRGRGGKEVERGAGVDRARADRVARLAAWRGATRRSAPTRRASPGRRSRGRRPARPRPASPGSGHPPRRPRSGDRRSRRPRGGGRCEELARPAPTARGGPARGVPLEPVPGREHDGDHRGRERLAEEQRAADRQHGDDVDAGLVLRAGPR